MSMTNMNSKQPLSVLVTGIGGGGHGEQILKALRLGQHPYRIIGTDISAYSTGKAVVDSFHVVPRASEANYMEVISELIDRYDVRAVFHGSEKEMVLFSDARQYFAAKKIYLPVNSPEVLSICQDKAKTASFLSERGFAVPLTREIYNLQDLESIHEFPVVLKPSIGGGGSANVFIAQDMPQLKMFASYLLSIYDRFIVQAYVGTPEEEYTVGVLFGADGELINSIAVKRSIGTALSTRLRVPNTSNRKELGSNLVISSGVSQGSVGRWPEVTKQCEEMAKALKPTAPVNIQCRLVNNQVMPFEINPRFSGTTSLRAIAGYNEPDVLIRRDVLGEKIPTYFEYKETVIMRGLSEHDVGSF